jgi:hypothetical protein
MEKSEDLTHRAVEVWILAMLLQFNIICLPVSYLKKLRSTLGSGREKVTGEWSKLYYFYLIIIIVIIVIKVIG